MASKWRIGGTLLIACNCDYGCPCNFNARPSRGHCEGGWLWHVEEGALDGVRLDGLSWGGGRAVSFYDERADEQQAATIRSLVRGEQGGPWGIFINTYELVDVQPRRFEVQLDGLQTRASIGDAMQLRMATIKNPVTGAEVHPGAVLPEGLVCKEATFGMSETFRVDSEIAYDHSGQYTAIAPFDYAGP
jgi:hypothetical protein